MGKRARPKALKLRQPQSSEIPPQGERLNAALAMIEAAPPKDEVEGALAVQMACMHTAAMAVLGKLDVAFADERPSSTFM